MAQARHCREAGAGGALGSSAGAPAIRAGQWLPAVAHGRARMEAGHDARGDLPRVHDAARAQSAAARDRLRRGFRLSRAGRRNVRELQGSRRARRAPRRRIRPVAPARAETRPTRAQPRGAPDPVADRGHHGHRFPVRWLSLRARSAGRSGDRARAIVRLRRERDCRLVFGPVAGPAGRRIPRVVLDPDADGAHVPRAAARRRALPHRHRASHSLLSPWRAGQPGAGNGPGSDHGRERR